MFRTKLWDVFTAGSAKARTNRLLSQPELPEVTCSQSSLLKIKLIIHLIEYLVNIFFENIFSYVPNFGKTIVRHRLPNGKI